MQKNPSAQSGIFNLRVLIALALCSVGVLMAMLGFAAAPPSMPLAPTAANWAIVTSPNTSTTQNNLLGVTCVSASDCWAVGSTVCAPTNNPNGVTSVSASDCWAVGYSEIVGANTLNIDQTLIERWDGNSWSIVSSPNATAWPKNFLYNVTCVSASDCWAVGFS